jgi:hypothetical protein
VPIDNEAQLPQPVRQVSAVERESSEAVLSVSAVHHSRREGGEGGYDLDRFGSHDAAH